MKKVLCTLAAAALLTPTGVAAQDGWWAPLSLELPQAEQDARRSAVCRLVPDAPACRGDTARADDPRSDRRDDDGWDTRRGDRNGKAKARGNARRGNGPPFCRNGQGHPVHGRSWCREKGWGTGAWVNVSWEDVILGRRDRDRRDRRRTLDRGGLLDVLGSVVLGRLEGSAARIGGGPLTGRLLEDRGRVLQVRAGDVPLAELLDVDRDGRVDRVLLRTER